jgi:two-component system, NarL family, nitrate/nitrite response regulator NarL
MKVLVADDHRLMIEGVRAALAGAEDIEVVGEAINGAQVLPLAHRLRPDLVLLDLSMPLMDGLACLVQLRQRFPEIKVVILSAYSEPERIQAALGAGASGYIVKGVDSRDLAATLRQMLEGNVYMTIGLPEPGKTADADAAGLTEREVEILALVAQGHSNGRVAQQLWVTEQTVKFHLTNIYRKLKVSNRTEAARAAYRLGLVQSPALDAITAA